MVRRSDLFREFSDRTTRFSLLPGLRKPPSGIRRQLLAHRQLVLRFRIVR